MLFVDDEPALVEFIVELFDDEGFDVTAVDNALEALDLVRANPMDYLIVITDQTMPGMLGTELAREIRALNPTVPLVLCTGYSDQVAEQARTEGTVDCLLQKPVRANALVAEVEKLLGDACTSAT
jgi:two-component system cell cycle sensor histidine kinase/response regulator CckA